jgi:chromosomal replication initiation ATPase DnaA
MTSDQWSEMLKELADDQIIGHATAGVLRSSQISFADGTFAYTVPPTVFRKDDERLDLIAKAVRQRLGEDTTIQHEFVTPPPLSEQVRELGFNPTPEQTQRLNNASRPPAAVPFYFEGLGLDPQWGPGSYLVSSWNNFAYAGAEQILNGNAATLCIIGPAGCGKSHLAQLLLHMLQTQGSRVTSIPCVQFRNQYVHDRTHRDTPGDPLGEYIHRFDAIHLEDVHFMATQLSNKNFLFFQQTIAALMSRKVKLILTMHDPPATYGFPREMLDRLDKGLRVQMYEPDEQARLELLRFLAGRLPTPNIPEEVLNEMALMPCNLHTYDGALPSLSLLCGTNTTSAHVIDWIHEQYGGTSKTEEITIARVILAAEQAIGATSGSAMKGGQSQKQCRARHLAWWLLEELLNMKHEMIANEFTVIKPDRSTVCTAISDYKRARQDPSHKKHAMVCASYNEAKRLLGVAVEVE